MTMQRIAILMTAPLFLLACGGNDTEDMMQMPSGTQIYADSVTRVDLITNPATTTSTALSRFATANGQDPATTIPTGTARFDGDFALVETDGRNNPLRIYDGEIELLREFGSPLLANSVAGTVELQNVTDASGTSVAFSNIRNAISGEIGRGTATGSDVDLNMQFSYTASGTDLGVVGKVGGQFVGDGTTAIGVFSGFGDLGDVYGVLTLDGS
ncbi:hypothetical protein [Yoonia sp. 208BN28-4]|uniref:hypothetical protein n=1 Tax=Yoonia sp. 208BN28-4 TaxID=3126505 RepID=UPI00309C156A